MDDDDVRSDELLLPMSGLASRNRDGSVEVILVAPGCVPLSFDIPDEPARAIMASFEQALRPYEH
jgi:hypothetical protein